MHGLSNCKGTYTLPLHIHRVPYPSEREKLPATSYPLSPSARRSHPRPYPYPPIPTIPIPLYPCPYPSYPSPRPRPRTNLASPRHNLRLRPAPQPASQPPSTRATTSLTLSLFLFSFSLDAVHRRRGWPPTVPTLQATKSRVRLLFFISISRHQPFATPNLILIAYPNLNPNVGASSKSTGTHALRNSLDPFPSLLIFIRTPPN